MPSVIFGCGELSHPVTTVPHLADGRHLEAIRFPAGFWKRYHPGLSSLSQAGEVPLIRRDDSERSTLFSSSYLTHSCSAEREEHLTLQWSVLTFSANNA